MGSHDCIFGVTFCKQKYLKKSMVKEWYDEKKTSITAEKLVNIFKRLLKFGYLSLRSMGLYFTVLHPSVPTNALARSQPEGRDVTEFYI